MYTKTCRVCGSEFAGIAQRVYDTHACQVKAYRSRRKQRETAANKYFSGAARCRYLI